MSSKTIGVHYILKTNKDDDDDDDDDDEVTM